MLFAGSLMNRIFELLAFIVAMYFPVALLTWLVIDKFFAAEEADGRSTHPSPPRERSNQVRVGNPSPRA